LRITTGSVSGCWSISWLCIIIVGAGVVVALIAAIIVATALIAAARLPLVADIGVVDIGHGGGDAGELELFLESERGGVDVGVME
jgi:hypothetical protein